MGYVQGAISYEGWEKTWWALGDSMVVLHSGTRWEDTECRAVQVVAC